MQPHWTSTSNLTSTSVSSLGVDPSAYSTRLCKEMRRFVDSGGSLHARDVLHRGWAVTQNARVQGSTTACVLTLDRNNFVNSVNVGDSGFLVVRDGECVTVDLEPLRAEATARQAFMLDRVGRA